MFIDIVITGVANVIFTIVALYTIEKWGRTYADIVGCRWFRTDLSDARHLLFLRGRGHCDGLSRSGRHLDLCDDLRTCHMDLISRDLPQPHPRHRDGDVYLRPLGGLLYADVLVPLDECRPRQQRFVLDL